MLIIFNYTPPRIDTVGYTKNTANGPIKLLHLPQGHDGYQSIHNAPPMMWTLYFKMDAYVDKILLE